MLLDLGSNVDNITSRLSIETEEWRRFFRGQEHEIISKCLTEAYLQLLNFAAKENLLSDVHETIDQVGRRDKSDLSDTTKLATMPVKTVFDSKFDTAKRKMPISACLWYGLQNLDLNQWVSSVNRVKTCASKALELENISRILSQARNVNAHVNASILDVGYSLLVIGSIGRLIEIFDYQLVRDEDIQLISDLVHISIASFVNHDSRALNFPESNTPVKTLIKTIQDDSLLNEVVPPETQETQIIIDPPIVMKLSDSGELQKQSLLKLRAIIHSDLIQKFGDNQRQKCILFGNSFTEVLRVKPTDIATLKKLMYIQFLLDRHPDEVKYQINRFGEAIVGVFAK